MSEEQVLDARLQQAGESLGLEVTSDQRKLLLGYLALLHKWNATYNLTAIRERDRMLSIHIVDSLAAVGPLRRQIQHLRARHVVDAGSGAGFPGAVLAVMLPEMKFTCIDSVGKKAAFIQQAAAELSISNLHAVHSRLEDARDVCADVITSRAFAGLPEMVDSTRALLADNGVWMAMKGKQPTAEIARLPLDVEVFHVEQLVVAAHDAERCLVWLRRKPAP